MDVQRFCKAAMLSASVFTLLITAGCSTNPLTGQSEFTGLMPAEQEASIGAAQHDEIVKQYGGVYNNTSIQNYVDHVGQSVAKFSDRQDVTYRFTVLDSPIVNAFALPGGYVYVTRGTLAVANSEAELAAVLGHEIGHVAARHQAARYSRGVVTQLGASLLGAAIGVPAVSQALGVGNNLYMSSYSRDQETQADQLGVRYLSRSGYNTMAMSYFLRDMNLYQSASARTEGKDEQAFSYFSSHPDTAGRAEAARAESQKYGKPSGATEGDTRYLAAIRGMMYGDSANQGFMRNGTFYHPDIGFAFNVPSTVKLENAPKYILMRGQEKTLLVFDIVKNNTGANDYLEAVRSRHNLSEPVENIDVNGAHAATISVPVNFQGREADLRLIVIEWTEGQIIRMQIMIPRGTSNDAIDQLKRISYSFRRMDARDKNAVRPNQIDLITAHAGDTIETLSRGMNIEKGKADMFAALNGLTPATPIEAGRQYKIVR